MAEEEKDLTAKIGLRLREARNAQGLSLQELADTKELGEGALANLGWLIVSLGEIGLQV